ncbi:MAG: HNH endonuclease [Solirubrobacterales bacterium]|nr:HNH endonuclease [Solirubrobacterales bacterium]
MKWSGGPIVAHARVGRFVQIVDCDAERLRQQSFGYRLYELDDYWESLRTKPRFFAVAVYLENERWLDTPILPSARSRGESWIVLDTPALEAGWLGNRPEVAEPGPVAPGRRRRPSRTITPSVRFEVFRRDGFTCQYCGRRAPNVVLHVDHVVAVVAGGSNDLDNLLTACSTCNVGKGGRSLVRC